MPAKDRFHQAVRHALEQEGWIVTHDPLHIELPDIEVYIDLGADRLLAAERESQKIAIEIKTFLGTSTLFEFHLAVGQFVNYRSSQLREVQSEKPNPQPLPYKGRGVRIKASLKSRREVWREVRVYLI
jgi:hypothetical protein